MQSYEVQSFVVNKDGTHHMVGEAACDTGDDAVKVAKIFQSHGQASTHSGRVLIRAGGEWIAGFSYGTIGYGWYPKERG